MNRERAGEKPVSVNDIDVKSPGLRVAIEKSFRLIGRRDTLIVLTISGVQLSLTLLDTLGVLLIGAIAILAVSGPTGGTLPVSLERLLDLLGLPTSGSEGTLLYLGGIAAFVLILKTFTSAMLTRRILRFLSFRQAKISGLLAKRLLHSPLLSVQSKSTYETTFALTSGISAATTGIIGNFTVVVSEIALMGVMAVLLLAIDPEVTVLVIIYFALIGWVLSHLIGRRLSGLGEQQAAIEVDSYGAIQEAIHALREVTASRRRGLISSRVEQLRGRAALVSSDTQFLAQVPKYVMELGMVFGAFALAVALLVTRGPAEAIGSIAIYLAAASRVMPSLMRLQTAYIAMKLSSGVAAPTFRLSTELRHPVWDQVSIESAKDLQKAIEGGYPGFVPRLDLAAVTFTYPGSDIPVLRGVTLSVPAGDSLAIVGPSGAGKSTLADLILGIIPPTTGRLLLSEIEPAVTLDRWPGCVGYVPQNPYISSGSVRENIAFGIPEEYVDDNLVWEALRRAFLDDFVKNSPQGLGTVLGERGLRFSGGQRQRIGLARALYSRPRLLVLDEATSALDAETEWAITQAIAKMQGTITVVAIAHRLATVMNFNQVAYLENGELLGVGSFEQLRTDVPSFNKQVKILGIGN